MGNRIVKICAGNVLLFLMLFPCCTDSQSQHKKILNNTHIEETIKRYINRNHCRLEHIVQDKEGIYYIVEFKTINNKDYFSIRMVPFVPYICSMCRHEYVLTATLEHRNVVYVVDRHNVPPFIDILPDGLSRTEEEFEKERHRRGINYDGSWYPATFEYITNENETDIVSLENPLLPGMFAADYIEFEEYLKQ